MRERLPEGIGVCRLGTGIESAGARMSPSLTEAYQQLDQAVLARRREFNQTFAKSLADWTSMGSTFKDVCGVEDVLVAFRRQDRRGRTTECC